MGTRSLTVFKDHDGTEIAVMYRQFDGYPEGHGKDLLEWGQGRPLVNGIRENYDKVLNGMGCASASCVAFFKKEAGGVYLYPQDTRNVWEEYIYTLYPDPNVEITFDNQSRLFLKVESIYGNDPALLYDGPLDEFDPDNMKSPFEDEEADVWDEEGLCDY